MIDRRSGQDRRAEPRNTPDRRNKVGRPRLSPDEDSCTLYVRVTTGLYDQLCKEAFQRHNGNISALTRAALEAYISVETK